MFVVVSRNTLVLKVEMSKLERNYSGSNSSSRAGQEINRKGYGSRGEDISSGVSARKNVPVGDYQLGSPIRPSTINHDNGFLRLGTVDATFSDYVSYAKWQMGVDVLKHIRPDLVDAFPAYQHFLTGNGLPRVFSYERYALMDQSGKKTLESAILEAKLVSYYFWMFSAGTDFSFTGPAISCGNSPEYPYPATENWQKAIGGHLIWLSANVEASPIGKKSPKFNVELTVHAEDRYNFNPNQADIATGLPDSENGRFSRAGLAHQYMNTSTLKRNLWWEGKPIVKTEVSRPFLDRIGRQEREDNIGDER